MIYKGKEYAEVTTNDAKVGDLLHATDIGDVKCDIWCFTTDDDFIAPLVNVLLPDNTYCLNINYDNFTRYRYVKDAEENETGREKICKAGGECACVRQLRGVAKRGSQA